MSLGWTLFADIEGFGNIFEHPAVITTDGKDHKNGEALALWLLRGLVQDVFMLGGQHFRTRENRLFAHLIGDGFLVSFDSGMQDLEKALSFSVALMRSTLCRGGCLKIGLTYGRVADVSGCYPREVLEARDEDGRVRMGEGIMTLTTVTGSGLIDAYKMAGRCKGPLVVYGGDIDRLRLIPQIGKSTIQQHCLIDWIHSSPDSLSGMLLTLNAANSERDLCQKLERYLHQEPKPSSDWGDAARRLIKGYSGG